MKKACDIIICGDICPTPDMEALFISGDARGLFKNLLDIFNQADLVVGNLECPLTDAGNGIVKCGPVLKGRKACINVLQTAGFNVLGLANNHIRDCGDEGVFSTLESCRASGIMTVGAGANAAQAGHPLVANIAGWKIGIMAFAEHEFNAAEADQGGANLFNVYDSFDNIRRLRTLCDYLFVLYHGGIEHYVYPSPILQKKCRKMIDAGADLVLCQHSHCVGTTETYKNGAILYGQGNTVFGYRRNSPAWNEGLIVKISLSENMSLKVTIEYLPIMANSTSIELMPQDQARPFLEAFFMRSQNITDQKFVNFSWQCFCESQQAHYLPLLFGLGRILNYANRKLRNRIVKLFFSKKRIRITMNLIRCEAHNEVVQTILDKYGIEKN